MKVRLKIDHGSLPAALPIWAATWQNQQNKCAKTQISLGIRPVWAESSLSTGRNIGSVTTHWTHSEDSDQTGRMPRLIWVFAGAVILLVLSWGGSHEGGQWSNGRRFPFFSVDLLQSLACSLDVARYLFSKSNSDFFSLSLSLSLIFFTEKQFV